jgi:hypothetical protein
VGVAVQTPSIDHHVERDEITSLVHGVPALSLDAHLIAEGSQPILVFFRLLEPTTI